MENPTRSDKAFPQTAELERWVDSQRKEGLVDVKFFSRCDDATVESFCGEVNAMLKSPIVADTDLI